MWAVTPSDDLEQQSLLGVPLNAGNVENDSAFWAQRTSVTATTTACRLSIAAAAADDLLQADRQRAVEILLTSFQPRGGTTLQEAVDQHAISGIAENHRCDYQ